MAKKPRAIKGKVALTQKQYDLLLVTAAQTDYGILHGEWGCLEAAAFNAALALKAIGEKTAQEEQDEQEDDE